ncbi:MAG: LuxR C-terminal-related transcriptional regulator [Synergistaceae bacterium]|jgi:LuxR family maltose regulon positive regulatory protein|nr:LuxR C-terminal-related transcriptional regulator [Synergistaceae bacterium]
MKSAHTSLPTRAGLLERPRVARLLERAVQNALVIVLAPPGYGKTSEVSAFVRRAPARVVWMRVGRLDNTIGHFWDSLVNAVSTVFPKMAANLRSLGFPLNSQSFDSFLRILAKEVYDGEQLLFVVDDFGNISDSEILSFFEDFIGANLENFCLTLLSDTKTDIGLGALQSGRLFMVTSDDLKFTPDEARQLFSLYGYELTDERLKELENNVDGWPMVLYLIANEFDVRPSATLKSKAGVVYDMFERKFFAAYPIEVKKKLIKLSLLHRFTYDISRGIADINQAEADGILKSNLFITSDSVSGFFAFHKMYRAFLAAKEFMLSDEEKRDFWRRSGDKFFSLGYYLESIDCYERCGSPDGMLRAIAEYSTANVVYSTEHANYILKKLSLLSKAFVEKNPIAEFMTAVALVNKLEFDRADEILSGLVGKLVPPDAMPLLGEAYWLMGQVNMLRAKPIFAKYFKLASDCLPDGSESKNYMHVRNIDVFSVENDLPGAFERAEKEINDTMPYYVRVAKGGGSGLNYLFSAEAGYHRFNFDTAKEYGHKAVFAAMDAGQHDILGNAHIILAKTAIMQGDLDECMTHLTFVRDYIDERDLVELYEMRDCAMGTIYIAVGDYSSLALWIVSPELSEAKKNRPLVIGGREKIIQAECLIGTGRYHEAIAFLEHNEEIYRMQGRWINVLKCFVLHSVAYLKLGDTERALLLFRDAYEMARGNKIIAPFVESAGNMRRLAEAAKKYDKFEFDSGWLDDVSRKASTHAKRLTSLTSEYDRHYDGHQTARYGKLSKRETEILNTLSLGLTRDEIAAASSLSINTVKSVIRSVYNKLGAINRADAVRIATSMRLLK